MSEMAELDALRAVEKDLRVEHSRLREEGDALRMEVEALRKDAAEHSCEWRVLAGNLEMEGDALRAENARLRKALKDTAWQDIAGQPCWCSERDVELEGHNLACIENNAANNSTPADSAKWLEERLAEARMQGERMCYQEFLGALDIFEREGYLVEDPNDPIAKKLNRLVVDAEQRGYKRGRSADEGGRTRSQTEEGRG